jgi:hypothetical protein
LILFKKYIYLTGYYYTSFCHHDKNFEKTATPKNPYQYLYTDMEWQLCLRSRKICWENEVIWTHITPRKLLRVCRWALFLSYRQLFGFKILYRNREGKIFIWIIIAFNSGRFGTIGDLIESKFKRIAGVKTGKNNARSRRRIRSIR